MKEPHDNLLHILNEITDFAFKGLSTKRKATDYSSGGFFSQPKSKTEISSFHQQTRSYLEFVKNNRLFQVSSVIFLKVINVPWRQLLK